MKRVIYTCDKCGEEIEGVMYTLTCYAEDIPQRRGRISEEVMEHNIAQNMASMSNKRHLCKACKDAITDGIFIL